MSSGIYSIIHSDSNKRYIGSALSLSRRKREHLSRLIKGTHNNRYLQRSFNKYGNDAFVFEIIEYCNFKDLIAREQFYIDKFETCNPECGFNLAPTAGSSLGLKRTKVQITRQIVARGAKLFHAYDKDKNYIGSWVNKKQCAADLGLKPSSANVIECLAWKKKTVADKILIYDDELARLDEKIQYSLIAKSNSFFILKEGIVLDKFTNQRECSRRYNLDYKKISLCLQGSNKTHKGYTFRYDSKTR